MAKIQGPKEGKTYSNIYKKEWTQPDGSLLVELLWRLDL